MIYGPNSLSTLLSLSSRLGPSTPAVTSNLLKWTQEFDQSTAWIASGVVVTANSVAAPDTTMTADTLAFSSAGSIAQTSTTAAATGSGVLLGASVTSTWTRFEKSGTFGGSPYVFSIYLKTSSAADVSLIVTRSGGFIQAGLIDFDEVGPFTVYAWGAQLETGSTATTYTPRTT